MDANKAREIAIFNNDVYSHIIKRIENQIQKTAEHGCFSTTASFENPSPIVINVLTKYFESIGYKCSVIGWNNDVIEIKWM